MLCEDKTLSLYSVDGSKVSTVMFPTEMKRTRDFCISRVNARTDREHLFAISVITSSGSLIVLNLMGMFDTTATFDSVYFSSFSIKVEPRLTSVTSWAVTARSKEETSRSKKANPEKRKAEVVDDLNSSREDIEDYVGTPSGKQVRFNHIISGEKQNEKNNTLQGKNRKKKKAKLGSKMKQR